MKNSIILKNYNILKDSGFSEEEILEIFNEKGVDIQGMRDEKTLIPPGDEMNEFSPEVDIGLGIKMGKGEYEDKRKQLDQFGEFLAGMSRSFGQGLTFGGADELEAWLRSKVNDTKFDDEIIKVRSDLKKFKTAHEGAALGSEIAGSLAVPFYLVGKLAAYLPYVGRIKEGQWAQNLLKRSLLGAGVGAADFALYSYGTGEGGWASPDRIQRAKEGAPIGAAWGVPFGIAGYALESGAKAISNRMAKKGMDVTDLDGNVIVEGQPGKVDREAMQTINNAVVASHQSLDDLSKVLDDVVALDPKIAEITQLADLTKPNSLLRLQHQEIGQTAPTGTGSAFEALTAKAAQFPEIAKTSVKKFLGKRIDDVEHMEDVLERWFKRVAKPFYAKANPVIIDDPALFTEINRYLKEGSSPTTPGRAGLKISYEGKDPKFEIPKTEKTKKAGATFVGKKIREAWNEAKVRIPKFVRDTNLLKEGTDELWGTLGDRLSGPLPLTHLHTLKVKIGDMATAMETNLKTGAHYRESDYNELMALYGKINKVLKDASPDYKIATKYIESGETYKKAFHQGVSAHKKGADVSATLMQRQLNGLSDADKNAYRLGYASQMYNRIAKANVNMQNEEKLLRLLSGEERDKIKVLARTEENALELFKKMRYISDMDARAKKLMGSQTHQMQQVKAGLEAPPTMPGQALGAVNRLRGGGTQAANTMGDVLDSDAAKRKVAAMSSMMDPVGEPHLRRTLNRLGKENRRGMSEVRNRSMYPSAIPGLLSPIEQMREQDPYYSLFGSRTY